MTLDGKGSSDPDGDSLTYSWSFVPVPTGSGLTTLTNPTAVHPTFSPDVAGQYVVGLVVNDGKVNSANTANVVITAQPAPPPIGCRDDGRDCEREEGESRHEGKHGHEERNRGGEGEDSDASPHT